MTSRFLVAGVAAGCIAAAGVGGFLAVRTATDPSARSLGAAEATVEAAGPIQQTRIASPLVEEADAPTATPPLATRSTAAPVRSVAPSARPAAPAAADRPAPVVETSPTAPVRMEAAAPPVLSVPLSDGAPLPVHPGPTVMALAEPAMSLVELPVNAVIGVRLDTTVSTASARVEDVVEARVTRPVVVDGETVLPTGARVRGNVTLVEPGGRFRERARIAIRFTSIAVDDDTWVPIVTEAIYREGEAPTGEATAKIGASAVVGTILGGVFGGRKGAAIGAATGAAGGTAMVAAGDPNDATIPSGTTFTVRLSEPAVIELPR